MTRRYSRTILVSQPSADDPLTITSRLLVHSRNDGIALRPTASLKGGAEALADAATGADLAADGRAVACAVEAAVAEATGAVCPRFLLLLAPRRREHPRHHPPGRRSPLHRRPAYLHRGLFLPKPPAPRTPRRVAPLAMRRLLALLAFGPSL